MQSSHMIGASEIRISKVSIPQKIARIVADPSGMELDLGMRLNLEQLLAEQQKWYGLLVWTYKQQL